MDKPLVSIIIPVYNGSNFIAEALEAATKQTYKNIEILVINDGSTDEGKTKSAVEPFLVDSRVRYIEKPNGGVSSALNLGLQEMKGEFFAWLSHDDLIEENSLAVRMKRWVKLGSNPKTIISTQTRFIGANGDSIFRLAPKAKEVHNVYDIISSTVNGCSLLVHKSLLEGHKFREDMIFMQDYYLWADLVVNSGAQIKVINRKLTLNRVHGGQVTVNRYDLLVRDFGEFAKTYIDPLMEKKDYKQLRDIVLCLRAHLSTRPFYQQYIDKYLAFLKEEKKWSAGDSLRMKPKAFVSFVVGKTRKKSVMPEPDNKVKKVVFVTNYVIFHQTGLWDEYVKQYPDVDFTYLSTAPLSEERKQLHYEDEQRNYVVKSWEKSEEELAEIFKDTDIVVFGDSEDSRVDKYIPTAKHLVVTSEHLSGRKHRGKFLDFLARFKFFNIRHKNWKKMNKSLLAMSYYSYNDFKHHGFKNSTYRFGYFPKLDYEERERDNHKLLYYGRLLDCKRVQDVIYALRILKKHDDKYTLDIVGEGPEKKHLLKLTKKWKLENSVTFYPFEEHEQVLERVRKAGIVFFPSNRVEGWGVVLNEMLSQKAIVFANTNAGSTMYLANKHNAFIYNNRRTLKKKLELFLTFDEEDLNLVRENAYNTINNEWNNEVAAKRMGELFTSLVRKESHFDKYKYGPLSKHENKHRKYISDETKSSKIEYKSQKNIALGSIFGYLSVILAILSGLVLVPWIIDTVGKGNYGVYGLANSIIALFLIDFGLSTTTNTYLSRLRAKGDKNGVERFLATIFKLYLIIDVVFIIVITVLYFLVDYIYVGYTPAERELLKPVLLIVGGYSVISFPSTCFTGTISTYEKFGWNKFVDFANKAVYFVLTILAIKLGWGVIGLVSVNAAAGIISVLMRFFYVRYYLGIHLRLRARVSRSTIKTIFAFSSWALVIGIASRLVFNITPSILGIVSDADQGAIFAVVTTIEGYIYTIGSMMSAFFMAKIARATANNPENKRKILQDMASRIGKLQFVVISLIVVGFACTGQDFIGFWMNSPTSDPFGRSIYFGIIAIAISEVISIPEIIFDTAMYTEGHIKPLAIISLIKAGVNVSLSFWLSSQYGALGACVAVGTARMVTVLLNNIVYKKYLGISLGRFFSNIYIGGGISMGVGLGVGLSLKFILPNYLPLLEHAKWRFLIIGFSVVLVYIIMTLYVTMSLPERYYYLHALKHLLKLDRKPKPKRDPNAKIKVLEIIGAMSGGGVEAFVISHFKELHNDMDFTFLVYDNSTFIPREEIESLGGKIVLVPSIKHIFKFKKALKKLLKSEHFDIIHSHMNTLSVIPLKVATKCHYQVRIAHSHSTSNKAEKIRNIAKNILRLFSRIYATRYLACSKHAAIYQFGKVSWDYKEVTLIHNAIDLDKFAFNPQFRNEIRNELGIKETDILAGNFGRMVDQKNQKYILKMAKATLNEHPEVKYLIVGSGEHESSLKQEIANNGLNNVIILPTRSDINRYYSALDVLVLPSLYEGLGLIAIEAEANGLYCLLSNFVPQETLVSGYGKYLPIEDKNIQDWVNEIVAKHERKDARAKLTEAGYDIKDSALKLKELYINEVKSH